MGALKSPSRGPDAMVVGTVQTQNKNTVPPALFLFYLACVFLMEALWGKDWDFLCFCTAPGADRP